MNKWNFAHRTLSLTWVLVGFLTFVVSLVGYVYYTYQSSKTTIMRDIDEKLRIAAHSANLFVGADYHDRLDKLSTQEFKAQSERLTKLAQAVGVQYVYTMIYDSPHVRFTASSYTVEDVTQGNITQYRDIYEEATTTNKGAFRSTTEVFETSIDKWGHFKTIFVPHITPEGQIYLTGADIPIAHIESQLQENVTQAALSASFFFCIALLVAGTYMLVYRRTLTTDARTGFANRLALEQDLTRAKRPHLSLAIISICELEEIISFYGAGVGDKVIQNVMRYFQNLTSPFKVYRLATSKLVLLCDTPNGEHYLNNLISEFPFSRPILNEPMLYIQLKAGIARGNKGLLLENAFIACRQAQQLYQTTYIYGQQTQKTKLLQESNLAIAKTVQSAFDQHRIIPYFTPRASIDDHQIVQYHCAPRVLTEQGVILKSQAFGEVIKHSRLNSQLTKQMLELCVTQFRKTNIAWSLALTPQDLRDPQMMECITQSINRYPQPNLITFELDEQALISQFNDMTAIISILRSKGVNILVNSRNSGLLTISRVLKMSINAVKLEETLIEQLADNPQVKGLVQHIGEQCKNSQIALIVSGIKSKAQLQQLANTHITLFEGEYIGAAAPHIKDNLAPPILDVS
ncbi:MULTISPECIES: EAL domain-containing protein [Pseudoalteromonas]|uniref:EAL domain-containing protein n=1 Tax=Pseudoalteromonas obscura TaxID=3048491 RepID=A0ABT7ELG9_9GAMM|nr:MULTISPECIES: EAL domain-containing protein [Pseudoalteromonas]MBQ4837529.1 GGDEF domain-containing protein [Pseudoalteromonas luteoviolacea]MDK2595891.1 EAL domain-containing protein [Pseudoalteromonas sp. P94(2023)]